LAALDEDLRLIAQVRATGLHQIDQRQLVDQRDFLCAKILLQAHRCDRTALDRAVADFDQAAHAAHVPDASNQPTAENVALAVVVVHAEAGERRQLEPRRALIEQQREAFARQQLAALFEQVFFGIRGLAHPTFESAELIDELKHRRTIGPEGFAGRIDATFDNGHGVSKFL